MIGSPGAPGASWYSPCVLFLGALAALSCLLPTAVAAPGDPGWSAAQHIGIPYPDGGAMYGSKLLSLPNGSIFAAWGDRDNGSHGAVHGAFWSPTTGWGPAEELDGFSWYFYWDTSVAADGTILLALCTEGSQAVYVRWFVPGVGWDSNFTLAGRPGPVEMFQKCYQVRSALDPGGNASLAWAQFNTSGPDRSVWTNYFTRASGWGTPTRVDYVVSGTIQNPLVQFVGGGEAVTTWQSGSGVNWTAYRPGQGWLAQARAPPSVDAPMKLERLGDSRALAVWEASTELKAAEYLGLAGWQSPITIASNVSLGSLQSLSTNRSAGALVAFARIGPPTQIWSVLRSPSGAWSAGGRISAEGNWSSAVLHDDGSAVSAVQRLAAISTGNVELAHMAPSGAWSAPTFIDWRNGTSGGIPQVARATGGQWLAVWRASDSTGSRPYASVLTPDVEAPAIPAGQAWTAEAGTTLDFSVVVTDNDPLYPEGSTTQLLFTHNATPVSLAGPNATYVFWTPGNYTVQVIATDAWGNVGVGWANITVLSPDTIAPTVNAGADVNALAQDQVRFHATASDNDPQFATGGSWGWEFDYNGTSYQHPFTDLEMTFALAGVYDLTFWAQDLWGNRAEDHVVVTVTMPDISPPFVDAGADRVVEEGQAVTLEGIATAADPRFPQGALFLWRITAPNGGTVNLTGSSQVHMFPTHGVYQVVLEVQDRWGNRVGDEAVVIVLARESTPPVVEPIQAVDAFIDEPVVVTAGASDNSPEFFLVSNYTWSFTHLGAAVTVYDNPLEFTFLDLGDFEVTLVVRDGMLNPSAPQRFTIHVRINDSNPPAVFATASRTSLEEGGTVSFSGSGNDDVSGPLPSSAFVWTIEGNGTRTTRAGLHLEYVFDEPGTYNVTLEGSDGAGNTGSDTLTITVTARPPPPPPPGSGGFLPGLEVSLVVGALVLVAVRRRTRRG